MDAEAAMMATASELAFMVNGQWVIISMNYSRQEIMTSSTLLFGLAPQLAPPDGAKK